MKKKFYVVWSGRQTGIFNSWDACKRQTDGFAGAKFQGFVTQEEAEAAYGMNINSFAKKKVVSADNRSSTLTAKDIAAIETDVKIFSDGACIPNPGEAGSGISIYRHSQLVELWYGLYNATGTNNTAELSALHHALIAAKNELLKGKSVAVFCDSLYSINCITQWAAGWKKNSWTKGGKSLKNVELIIPMHTLFEELKGDIQIHHVNGHVGIEGNELADRMSALAIETQEEGLRLFAEPLEIQEILSMKAG
jgi:ribonuclease HI